MTDARRLVRALEYDADQPFLLFCGKILVQKGDDLDLALPVLPVSTE